MFRLRNAIVAAAIVATAGSAFSALPAAADQLAACDPAAAPGLTWSAPSFLAWGRQNRIGADVADSTDGPTYADDSVALSVDAGSADQATDPVDSDLEFVLKAPTHGAEVHASASWALVDDTGTVRCAQTAALSVALGEGKTLRWTVKPQHNGVAWSPANAGDCHDIALQQISLTVQQGPVTRHLTAADQCRPAGSQRVATKDWELVLRNGHFELHALTTHSSLRTRLRFALRVGSHRVASGSLSLVRTYRPARLIVVADQAFQDVCVHGIYPMKWYGSTIGCKIPGVMSVRLALV